MLFVGYFLTLFIVLVAFGCGGNRSWDDLKSPARLLTAAIITFLATLFQTLFFDGNFGSVNFGFAFFWSLIFYTMFVLLYGKRRGGAKELLKFNGWNIMVYVFSFIHSAYISMMS